MATNQQQEELHKTIWAIADDLRGAVDGWDFKQYVLGTLFFRFISENLCDYINAGERDLDPNFDYANLSDEEAEEARQSVIEEKGYFILPSQLFQNVCKTAAQNKTLNTDLQQIFKAIENSAINTPSEQDLKGLFSDFKIDSNALGGAVDERNKLLAKVLLKVQDMDLGCSFTQHGIDAFGDAYEYLMQMYAGAAGKSGGEFFTPQEVSEVLARIASHDNPHLRKVYDPACGSGSLLLKFAKYAGDKKDRLQFYGQEINPTTYNLCRINMFLHNINYEKFDIQLGDTLHRPLHEDDMPFDAIVSNPPYSLPWDGKDNPLLMNDPRYAPAGILAPKSAADLAFTMHMLYHLAESGTCAIVEFPGVLYRGGAEQKIREYLVRNNFVDTVIQLPQNLFFGVGIATCIIVLRKGKRPDNKILFIDASNQYKKIGNKNHLEPKHQDAIVEAYQQREDKQYFCRLVDNNDVKENNYNLSVSAYVEQEDKREKIDIDAVNSTLQQLVKEGQTLRRQVDEIVKALNS